MQPKVSIIVPIYNAEKYLDRCVDSILSQTFLDFELLLIDDGSPDRSGEICDEYAQKDNRIHVFHKENGGVASARQFGLEHAQGEFVIHADPDDYVEPSMLEELYECAKKNQADMVICDFYIDAFQHIIEKKQNPSNLDHLTVLRELFQHLHGSCWNKLLKRTCYKQYGVSFPSGVSYCEDLSFWVRLLKEPIRITYLPKAFYHYVQHETSIVRNYMNKKEDDGWKLMTLLGTELKAYPDIRKIAQSRTALTVVKDAFMYGKFNSFTFFIRYAKYVPYLLQYKKSSLRERLFYVRVCLGLYSYYQFRRKQ